MNLKNSGDSTGVEPMTSAMPVQCSNQLSYEVTQLRAGQFVGLMQEGGGVSRVNNRDLQIRLRLRVRVRVFRCVPGAHARLREAVTSTRSVV